MVEIYDKIRAFSEVAHLSKHEQIVNGLLTSIEDRVVERGQMLPSINQMSNELGFARKTIDRAYGELKDRGLVESRNRLGFFVRTEAVDQAVRVALVLYEFRPFQEMFYNVFRQSLGENVQVDTFFHHNNLSVFEDIMAKVAGRYGVYVVAPVVHERSARVLRQLTSNRLLLIDRRVNLPGGGPFAVQEFGQSTYRVLEQLEGRIRRYERTVLFFREDADYPPAIREACGKFFRERRLELVVEPSYAAASVRRGQLYLTIGDTDLWTLLEDVIERGWVLGRDVGVLSHNESRIKKIVHGGISTWSTDFGEMAELAARFVLERNPERTVVPTKLIDRGSV